MNSFPVDTEHVISANGNWTLSALTINGSNVKPIFATDEGVVGLSSRDIYLVNGTSAQRVAHQANCCARIAARDNRGTWALWVDNDVFLYGSTDSINSSQPIGYTGNLTPPLPTGVAVFDDGREHGFLWAEYTLDSNISSMHIYRWAAGGKAEPVLTVPSTSYRHFHDVVSDPYAPGQYYATTGDNDTASRFFQSADYGRTWSVVDGAGGAQRFRTVQLLFTQDGIYWAMDGTKSGACQLLFATRSDIAHPRVLANLTRGNGFAALGAALLETPRGILVGMRDEGKHNLSSIPLKFFDLSTGTLSNETSIPLDYGLGGAPGVLSMVASPAQSGETYLVLSGVDNPWGAFSLGAIAIRQPVGG